MPKLLALTSWSGRPLRLVLALSALAFLMSCGPINPRLEDAATRIGEARAAEAPDPALPADCRRTERAGLVGGERLDEAVLLYDEALSRQNARTLRCADWYDDNHGEAR